MGADATALQLGTEGGSTAGAHGRRVLGFSAHNDRPASPTAFLAGPFAGRFGGPILVRLAGFPGRGGGSFGLAAALGAIRAPSASPVTSIGVVARRRARTGPGVLARPVGQRARQLMQPPSQVLQFLARHRRKVCPIDILQLRGELGRHARRRILFAPKRKPQTRRSNGHTPDLIIALQRTGGVNGCSTPYMATVPGSNDKLNVVNIWWPDDCAECKITAQEVVNLLVASHMYERYRDFLGTIPIDDQLVDDTLVDPRKIPSFWKTCGKSIAYAVMKFLVN